MPLKCDGSAYVYRCTGLYMIIYGVRQVRACELSRYITGNVYLYIALCTESFWVNDLYEAQASRSRVTCFDIVFHCLLVDNDKPQGKITTDTFIGPVHTNAFTKVCVFISLKTQWESCVHTIVFISFYTSHTETMKTLSTSYCACVKDVIWIYEHKHSIANSKSSLIGARYQ